MLIFSNSFSQIKLNLNLSVQADTIKVRHYQIDKNLSSGIKQLIVPFEFNESEILNPGLFDSINGASSNIISIDYVYTQYKDKKTQDKLNKRRIFEFYLTSPTLLNQSMTKWRFVEQLGFTKDEDAKKLFHGFVIQYRTSNTYQPKNENEVKEDVKIRMERPRDSLFSKVFTRNPQFIDDVVVTDFTCSMSPYYLEVIAWYCLHKFQNEVSFSFFNDGDGISNDKKLIGKTGGVHQVTTNSLDTIAKYVLETIKTGCSGDNPENDVEAILKSIEKNPKAKEIILIADNWSDMRDYSLRFQVDRPVRIILCGTENGINPQYLNLAYITKGSVHTMEEDLSNLFKLSEGSKFSLGGETFVIRFGKIEKLTKL